MFKKINNIIDCETSSLKALARAAGADYQTFWRGADLSAVDLKGQDLSDFDLTDAFLDDSLYDIDTIFPADLQLPTRSRFLRKTAPRVAHEGDPNHQPSNARTSHATTDEAEGRAKESLSSRIAPHVPYLRRYSRAVTGSQATGDAYVAAVLEALIADPDLFPSDQTPRVSLYKLFSSLWQSVDVNIREDAPTSAWEERASRNLKAISPLPRQAFLLVAVEGFTTDEAATILDVKEAEFSTLIDQASSDIGRQVSTKIMIIEDEPLIAMDLEQMVESLGHTVTGIARTQREAIELFERQRPGMVLADIQLADGSSGIDAVKQILSKVSVPAIFITAFPDRLLTGNRPEPTFLVTKPFNPDMVKALISQALFSYSS